MQNKCYRFVTVLYFFCYFLRCIAEWKLRKDVHF